MVPHYCSHFPSCWNTSYTFQFTGAVEVGSRNGKRYWHNTVYIGLLSKWNHGIYSRRQLCWKWSCFNRMFRIFIWNNCLGVTCTISLIGRMLIPLGSRIQLEQLPTPKTATCDTPNTSHSVFCSRSPARSRQLLALRWIRNRPPVRHRSNACPTTNQSPYLTRSILRLRSRCTILFSHRKRNAHNISHNRLQGYTRILSGS